ncbi:MAG: hypothetical protein N3C63_03370 [Rhodocyclaceae bacterium]|nr:hypothetical protein [Rhodocyclaceae bacterium]
MKYHCTPATDLHELLGTEGEQGFEYGPLATALKNGEELVLEASHQLSRLTIAKIMALLHGLFIVETEETLYASPGFRLVLH